MAYARDVRRPSLFFALACGLACESRAKTNPPPPPAAPITAITVVAVGLDPDRLVSDAASAYWLDRNRNSIMRVDLASGAAPQPIAPATGVTGLALDEGSLYFGRPGALMRVPKSGGQPATLATVEGMPEALAVDDANVYWLDLNKSSAFKLPKAGGTPRLLGKDASFCLPALAVDDAFLYWQGQVPRAIMRMPKDGGPLTPLATVETYWASDLTVDSTSVYWWAEQRIWQVDKRGGRPRAIVHAQAKNLPVWLNAGASAFYLMESANLGGEEVGPGTPHTGKLIALARPSP